MFSSKILKIPLIRGRGTVPLVSPFLKRSFSHHTLRDTLSHLIFDLFKNFLNMVESYFP